MKATTADRLKEIMKYYELRQVDILKRVEPYCKQYGIKMGRNDLSQYVSGKVSPGQEKLTILAMALGVSETWLMGYDVPMERIDPKSANEYKDQMKAYAKKWNFQYYEKEILYSFTGLSDVNKKKVIDYSKNLLNIQQAEEEQQHFMPNAASQRTDLSKSELSDKTRNKHDDDIMDDPNF